jgi:hypothetical protein
VNAYEQGLVRATPIVNGPFDPYAGDDDPEAAELASAFTRLIVQVCSIDFFIFVVEQPPILTAELILASIHRCR